MAGALGWASARHALGPAWVWAILLAPPALPLLDMALYIPEGTRGFVARLHLENGPTELASFAIQFAAAVMALRLAIRFRGARRDYPYLLFLLIFGAGMFFTAMEEIAWGQWFLGFETPETIRYSNLQGELTIHNLAGVSATIEYMRLAFGIGGLVGILVDRVAWFRPISVSPLLLPLYTAVTVLSLADIVVHAVSAPPGLVNFSNHLTEVIELLIGLGAVLYLWLKGRERSVARR